MIRKFFLILTFLVSSESAHALVPPYWDSVNQIEAVMKSDKLDFAYPILSIKKLKELVYEIKTIKGSAQVTLNAHPPKLRRGMVGGRITYTVKSVEKFDCD